MTRGLPANIIGTLSNRYFNIVKLIYAEFDGGDVYLCNGTKSITWDGHEWLKTGGFIGIETVEETLAFEAPETSLTFTISNSVKTILLNTNFVGNRVKIFNAFFDIEGNILDNPYLVYDGLMNGLDMKDDPDSKLISISIPVTSYLARFDDKIGMRTNPEELKVNYPDDTFFDQVPKLVDKAIEW